MVWKLALSLVAVLAVYTVQLDTLGGDRKASALILLVIYSFILVRAWKKEKTSMPMQAGIDYLIAYATETGTARKLARQTLKQLKQNKVSGQVIELNDLLAAPLPNKGMFIIASTCGQGDAPRTGQDWLKGQPDTSQFNQMPYAILALGDRNYRKFCGFGLQVDSILRAAGGQPMFDTHMVNQANEDQIRYWLSQVSAHTEIKNS